MTYFCKAKPSPIRRTLFLTFIILVLWVFLHNLKAAPEDSDTTLKREPAALDGDGAPRDFISKVRNPTEEIISTEKTKIPIEIPLRQSSGNDVALVAPKALEEDITWMPKFCKEYGCTTHIFTTDETPEDGFLVPPTRKGREAAAYLTYIVDNYDNLSPYTIFIHGMEEHWHNDAAGPKTSNVLWNLRYEAIKAYGYVNLRCLTIPGCPDSLHPLIVQKTDLEYQNLVEYFPLVYSELFDVDPAEAPTHIGHQCCGQFAVTAETIRHRPHADYKRILNWITNTDRTDAYGAGWILEKLWHIIFGMDPSYCHSVEQCRCDLYGWCGPNPSTSNKVLVPVRWP